MLSSTRRLARAGAGFSLIEVLVTLVVFSVGMLGAASLQSVAKKSSYDAVQRTTASQLGHELLERMRTNPSGLDAYRRNIGGGQMGAPATDCSLADCDAPTLAAFDLWETERSIDGLRETRGQANTGGLTEPTVCITGPAGGVSGVYRVSVAWRGLSSISYALDERCGTGNAAYGDDDSYRRVLVLETFVDAG